MCRHYNYADSIWLIKAIPNVVVIAMNTNKMVAFPISLYLQYASMINMNYQVRICFGYGYWGISHAALLAGNRICVTDSLRNESTMFFVNSREKENICMVNTVNLYMNVIGFVQSIALKWFLCLACRAKKKAISELLMKSGQLLLQPLGLAVITLITMNWCGFCGTIIRSSMRIS